MDNNNKYEYLGKVEFRIIVLENELEILRKEKEKLINEIYSDNTDNNSDPLIKNDSANEYGC